MTGELGWRLESWHPLPSRPLGSASSVHCYHEGDGDDDDGDHEQWDGCDANDFDAMND